MKTKNCPFCSKEISDEAIICKYCHRLLIDENGNDILPEEEEYDDTEAAAAETEEPAFDEEKTIVYNKKDLQDLMNKSRAESGNDNDATEEFDASAVIGADAESGNADDDGYDDFGDDRGGDDYPEDDFPGDDDIQDDGGYEPDPQPAYQRGTHRARENEYDDEELANAADYDPKRTFMVTAIVTLGILLIIIVAVLVGYKLFGFGDTQGTTTSQTPVTTPSQSSAAPVDPNAVIANPTDSAAFVPQITDDTVSENPEEIVNSSLSDPVIDPNAAVQTPPVVDSAASTPETVVADSSSAADSQANIVIIPDPDAVNSAVSTESSTDDSTDSIGDGPAADSSEDNTSREPAGPGAPGFDAAGSYYSWGEAEQLIGSYASANNLGDPVYYGGTDGVEMIYAFYDDYGNATLYRVDLQTGYVSAY